ncbi:MAG TPA: ShlB/FhaC/HecB family hemolysin secretion/activation protein [Burkholderiales bacterium]|nr:ShlB/FhaC/HecB family hemolysin secretion/activation protein [Burkholderiales bacterium]
MTRALVILTFLGLAVVMASAAAQDAKTSPAPLFDITRFDVEGNTLLKANEIEEIVSPYSGTQKDFADVQRALEALQNAYRKKGYGTVQVVLPEQKLIQGVVRLKVIEARVGAITIQGNEHHDDANIRHSLPSLKQGLPPNSRDIASNLRVANENPSKQTTVLFKAGEQPNEVDATIKVADEKPWKVYTYGDNTGDNQTGTYRVGAGFQYSNLFNLDNVFTFQAQTSPDHASDVKIYGGSYHVPLYNLGDSIDVIAGYSDVNSGTVQNLFNVSGSGTIVLLRYNDLLPRIGEIYEHKLVYGLDYEAFKNSVTTVGTTTSVVPNVNVHPASLTYFGTWHLPSAEVAFNAGYSMNIPGGSNGGSAAFEAARFDATDTYHIVRYSLSGLKAFANDFQFHAAINGQWTPDALVPGVQYGLGGFDSVRGFHERAISNDAGYQGTVEAYSPDLGSVFLLPNVHTRLLLFYDYGAVSRNHALPGELQNEFISSTGFGIRINSKYFSVRADFAQVLHPGDGETRYSNRAHVGIVFVY